MLQLISEPTTVRMRSGWKTRDNENDDGDADDVDGHLPLFLCVH